MMKSEVKGYYAKINHGILFAQLEMCFPNRLEQRLLWQYLTRTVYLFGGELSGGGGILLGVVTFDGGRCI
jgi:hypothetical protein